MVIIVNNRQFGLVFVPLLLPFTFFLFCLAFPFVKRLRVPRKELYKFEVLLLLLLLKAPLLGDLVAIFLVILLALQIFKRNVPYML